MEDLPRGANFRRAKTLWELGLNFAGDPATPYGGNRDVCITIGNGSGEEFRPFLRMATGSPISQPASAWTRHPPSQPASLGRTGS